MVTYDTVFEDRQYIAVARAAAKYFEETAKSYPIPMIIADGPDDLYYRHTLLLETKASQGIADMWSPQGPLAQTPHGYTDFYLGGKEMHLHIPKNDINHYKDRGLISQKYDAAIKKFALDVDLMNFIGNYPDPNDRDVYLDAGGLLTQATSVVDLAGGASNLATKGYIWAGIKKMIDAIPFRKRESSPPMLLYMSENLASKLSAPDRVYMDMLERDFIYKTFVGPEALPGRKIGQIIVTDKILVYGTDTAGTNDRMLLVVPDPAGVARVVSRGFSLLDEESIMFNVHQAWGYRGALCVFDAEFVQFTEQIVWA
jgi:hypothetical protein